MAAVIGRAALFALALSLRAVIFAPVAFLATAAMAEEACHVKCKILISACQSADKAHCISDLKLPPLDAGMCDMQIGKIVAEWLGKYPDYTLTSARCVAPDEQKS